MKDIMEENNMPYNNDNCSKPRGPQAASQYWPRQETWQAVGA